MRNYRVYLIDVSKTDKIIDAMMPNNEFAAISEVQGLVYSIDRFELEFNEQYLPTKGHAIRFININTF